MTNSERLAERFALLKARLKLKSYEALADVLGYSRTYLHSLATNKSEPSERFMEELQRQEAACGISFNSEHNDKSSRLAEPATDLGVVSGVVATDAEIQGLAALVSLHAANVQAGTHRGDIPIVREALEKALESRGRLPRKRE